MLAVNGEPGMCFSSNLIVIAYSPGAVGKYETEQLPSSLSSQVISVFEGPSTAKARPPKIYG